MEVACLGRRFCKSDDHLERWRPRLANLQEGLSSFWRLLKRWCHPEYRAQELPGMCVVGITWRLRICFDFFFAVLSNFHPLLAGRFPIGQVRLSFCKSKIWISWSLCCFTCGSIFHSTMNVFVAILYITSESGSWHVHSSRDVGSCWRMHVMERPMNLRRLKRVKRSNKKKHSRVWTKWLRPGKAPKISGDWEDFFFIRWLNFEDERSFMEGECCFDKMTARSYWSQW